MDVKSLIAKLHPLERAVVPVLAREKELTAIIKASGLQEIEVMRALQWLENKELLKIHTEKKRVVTLDSNGILYQREGLPERKFLMALTTEFQSISEIARKTHLTTEELKD